MLKRTLLTFAALATLAAGVVSAETQIHYGFRVGITNAPPAPKVVYHEVPKMVMVPGGRVCVVQDDEYDCDVFRVGAHWYAMNRGFWYRARSHRGPFTVVDVRSVPRAIFSVPSRHWKHHPHGKAPELAKGRGRKHSEKHDRGSVAAGD
jgi:hypothetical protein